MVGGGFQEIVAKEISAVHRASYRPACVSVVLEYNHLA
jgi:hypothetical protein